MANWLSRLHISGAIRLEFSQLNVNGLVRLGIFQADLQAPVAESGRIR